MLNGDIISMPDKWEYPWYAAWDLAFHTIALSLVDFDFAKEQLLLMLRSLYSHPNGQMPAYEWNFSDVNPPVHAWATLFLYKYEKNLGREDLKFLARSFQGLMLNFNWWVNRKDPQGKNVFAGGFLGLDNIGVFDRSAQLPTGGSLEQADGTAWMAFYAQNMLEMALTPQRPRPGLRGGRVQVPRERHLDQLRDGQGRRARGRHVGRGGRLLLRRPPAAERRGVPPEGPLDGGAAAAVREHHVRGGHGDAPPEVQGAHRSLREALPRGDRPRGADRRRPRRPRRAPHPVSPHQGEARAHPRLHARRERVPLRVRDPRPLAVPPRAPVRLPCGRPGAPRRVPPRRLGQRDVRGQLELAGADLDAGQYPDRAGSPEPLRLLRRRLQGRVPDRLREPDEPLRGREGDLPAPREHLPARRERPPAGPRRRFDVPGGPALARPRPLLRVLPRRQRGRHRGQPPDRLDGPRRTPARPLRTPDRRRTPWRPPGRGSRPAWSGSRWAATRRRTAMATPRYPALFQVNTRVRLSELVGRAGATRRRSTTSPTRRSTGWPRTGSTSSGSSASGRPARRPGASRARSPSGSTSTAASSPTSARKTSPAPASRSGTTGSTRTSAGTRRSPGSAFA